MFDRHVPEVLFVCVHNAGRSQMAATLHLPLAPRSATSRARLCLRMGFTLSERIASLLGWPADARSAIVSRYGEYEEAVGMLGAAGFPMEHGAEDSWADFKGLQVNYEAAAYRPADYLTAPPAPWSGVRLHLRTTSVLPHRPLQ